MLLKDDDLVRMYQKEYKETNEFVRRVLDDLLTEIPMIKLFHVLGHLLLSVSVMLIYRRL